MYMSNIDIFGNLGHIFFVEPIAVLIREILRNQGFFIFEAKFNTFFYSLLCCSIILQQYLMLEYKLTLSVVEVKSACFFKLHAIYMFSLVWVCYSR